MGFVYLGFSYVNLMNMLLWEEMGNDKCYNMGNSRCKSGGMINFTWLLLSWGWFCWNYVIVHTWTKMIVTSKYTVKAACIIGSWEILWIKSSLSLSYVGDGNPIMTNGV